MATQRNSSKPNIVYIFADDMGYGDLSCLNGESKIHTRRMDQIAAQGMVFTDAHSSSAVCTPSRYSLLTGRYNWRSTLKQGVLYGYSDHLLEEGRMTVASYLRDHGYYTACVGKWHLGMDWHRTGSRPSDVDYSKPLRGGPIDVGFDYFFGISASLDMPPYVYIENDRVTALPDHETGNDDVKAFWRKGPTAPDFDHEEVLPRCTKKAVDIIVDRAQEDEPFFLYVPLPAPHTPILPLSEYQGRSGTNAYGDFVLQVDAGVGALLDALETQGVAENTIVIVSSDNGCSPRADFDELASVGHNPSYVFRGHKADIYEGGHRIPLLIRWPERIRPGSRCDQTVCLSDLLATCVELMGETLPDDAGEDSVSNLSLWDGSPEPVREATVHHSINGSFSIRKGKWKLEMCPGSGGWSYPRPGSDTDDLPAIQLYDLDVDIGERTNCYSDHPHVVDELKELLTAYVRDGRSTPGKPQPNTGARYWPQLNWLVESDLA
jgi:arylsulfatase A-like enzyme